MEEKIIWVTLAGSIIAYILLAYSQTLYGLFFARAFAGFMAGNISTAQAYIADITDKNNRAKAMGLFGAAFWYRFYSWTSNWRSISGVRPQKSKCFFTANYCCIFIIYSASFSFISFKR